MTRKPGSENAGQPAPREVLILLPRQLGDIVLGLPLAHALKARFPGVRISWYAHPMGRLVLEGHPWVDELLCYPVPPKPHANGERPGWWKRARVAIAHARAEFEFALSLRARRFDTVIDAMSNPRTALLARLTGAAVRVSFYSRFPRTLAFTHLLPRARLAQGYVAKARLSLLSPWGLDAFPDCAAKLPCTEGERSRVDDVLRTHGLNARGFLVCAPAHRHAVRKWPGSSYVAFARSAWERHGLRTVWLWGPGEDVEVGELQRALVEAAGPLAGVLPPLLSLRETAHLASFAIAFVGNSNGLSHVAVAGGTRSVQIHGPTDPTNWTFPDPGRHAGVQRAEGCVRCERNTCALARRECLDDLEVGAVFAAFEKVCGMQSVPT
jgi:heptosyltransferase-3